MKNPSSMRPIRTKHEQRQGQSFWLQPIILNNHKSLNSTVSDGTDLSPTLNHDQQLGMPFSLLDKFRILFFKKALKKSSTCQRPIDKQRSNKPVPKQSSGFRGKQSTPGQLDENPI